MLKILSIDDEPMITELIGFQLEIHGMQVVTANTGKSGIELARSEAPDLVLLDMMMPDMSGPQVCQQIRSFSSVPVLAFSALSGAQDIDRALDAGFSGFVEKPCSGDHLAGKILEFISVK